MKLQISKYRKQKTEVRGQKNLSSVFCYLSSGFTLVEIMLVVIIIAALAAMIITTSMISTRVNPEDR